MEFKVGDRVKGRMSGRYATVEDFGKKSQGPTVFVRVEGGTCEEWYQSDVASATTAAPETPRAFVVGDRALSKGGEWVTVTRVAGDHVAVRWDDDGMNTGNLHPASLFTLVTPAAPADPEWLVEARKELPPGWTLSFEDGVSHAAVIRNDFGKTRAGPHPYRLTEGDLHRHPIAFWVRQLAASQLWPDPYATPTVEDRVAKLPPMPSEPPGDGVMCRAHGGRATPGPGCGPCERHEAPYGPAPDLSLTNEVGFPTMPKPKKVFGAAETGGAQPLYREGDRVVVTPEDSYHAPYLATVIKADDEGAYAWWIDWRGKQVHDFFYNDDLRPATAREAREGKVQS